MATDKLTLGSQTPQFNLPSTDGKNYSLESFSNKQLLVVIFSCNHCPYVQAYEDRIIEIQEKYKDHISIAAISSNETENYPEDSFEKMKERAQLKGFNFPYLFDESQEVAKAFGATHTPEIFLFDRDRKLAFHGKIDDNWQEPQNVKSPYLKNAIDELINGKKVSVPETFTIGCTIKWKK
ncbi:MAG: thioredoxin family protein [Bacteroidota bacterium]